MVTLHFAISSPGTARNGRGSLEVPAVPRHKEQLRDKTRLSGPATGGPTNRSNTWSSSHRRQGSVRCCVQVGKRLAHVQQLRHCLSANLSPEAERDCAGYISDVNVGDGPTKYDHRAVTLLREFLQRPVWEIGFTDLHIRPEVARTCSCQEATVSEGSAGVHT